MSNDIDRQVHFAYAPPFDIEDSSGINNTWIYDRAPEGYLFELHSVEFSTTQTPGANGIVAIFDGHEYTHWNLYPGVESRELLGRAQTNANQYNTFIPLNGWKCKEYTIGLRSTHSVEGYKIVAIVWFYLKKATRSELLEYALKHPVREDTFKRAMRGTTVELGEA